MKKTLIEFQEIDFEVVQLFQKNPNLKDSKFGYVYKRFSQKNYLKHREKYSEELTDVRVDNALEDDKTKEILTDESVRGYKYSKEGLKAVIKAEREIVSKWEKLEFDVDPYFCKKESLPVLTELQEELFKGCLFE